MRNRSWTRYVVTCVCLCIIISNADALTRNFTPGSPGYASGHPLAAGVLARRGERGSISLVADIRGPRLGTQGVGCLDPARGTADAWWRGASTGGWALLPSVCAVSSSIVGRWLNVADFGMATPRSCDSYGWLTGITHVVLHSSCMPERQRSLRLRLAARKIAGVRTALRHRASHAMRAEFLVIAAAGDGILHRDPHSIASILTGTSSAPARGITVLIELIEPCAAGAGCSTGAATGDPDEHPQAPTPPYGDGNRSRRHCRHHCPYVCHQNCDWKPDRDACVCGDKSSTSDSCDRGPSFLSPPIDVRCRDANISPPACVDANANIDWRNGGGGRGPGDGRRRVDRCAHQTARLDLAYRECISQQPGPTDAAREYSPARNPYRGIGGILTVSETGAPSPAPSPQEGDRRRTSDCDVDAHGRPPHRHDDHGDDRCDVSGADGDDDGGAGDHVGDACDDASLSPSPLGPPRPCPPNRPGRKGGASTRRSRTSGCRYPRGCNEAPCDTAGRSDGLDHRSRWMARGAGAPAASPARRRSASIDDDARRATENMSVDIVSVWVRPPFGLLDLRGGGGAAELDDCSGVRPVHGPPPVLGGGVSLWLDDDSDLAEWETSEVERRRSELMIAGTSPAQREAGPISTGMIITGTVGESRIAVCEVCMCNIELAYVEWQSCRCGAFRCRRCPRDSCYVCGDPQWTIASRSAEDETAAHDMTLGHDAMPTPWWTIPLSEARGVDQAPWTDAAGPLVVAMDAVDTVDDGSGADAATLCCRACGMAACSLPSGTSWRICRCGSAYCQWCLDGGCIDCPVIAFWHGDGDEAGYDEAAADDGGLGSLCNDGPSAAAGRPWYAGVEYGIVPCQITPEEAHGRRLRLLEAERDRLVARRAAARVTQRLMTKEGLRPRREKPRRGTITFISANVNCADRLTQELQWGTVFKHADYLAIQELRLLGDQVEKVTAQCRGLGWEAIIDEAYVKVKKAGGGTAVIVKGEGLRPLAAETGAYLGRVSLAIATALRGAVVGSLYGITGGRVADQLGLWKHLAVRLTALGRPFVVGGDWQVDPDEPELVRLADSLEAAVCHPGAATNSHSNTRIDFFLVSRSLLKGGWNASVNLGCAFAPHAAVQLELSIAANDAPSFRLSQPRLLPISPQVGPQLPRPTGIDWRHWVKEDSDFLEGEGASAAAISGALKAWTAGAEVELLGTFGIPAEEQTKFMGIGMDVKVVQSPGPGRFREVADEMGLTGQRLDWAVKGIRALARALATDPGTDEQRKRLETCSRMSHRAAAHLREVRRSRPRDNEVEYYDITVKLLATLSRSTLWRHGRPPLLTRATVSVTDDQRAQIDQLVSLGAGAVERLALWRRREAVRARRSFAAAADLRTAHRATKRANFSANKSASADKRHLGEATEQEAANRGLAEWTPAWQGDCCDHGDELVRMVDDLYALGRAEDDAEELLLAPLEDDDLLNRVAAKFKGNTGVGTDWLRPRHVSKVSSDARKALLRLLRAIEAARRWPMLLRSVIEIALGKKGGGARLVGQASAVYRIWAKLRFIDVRRTLEERIARPYLPAAPGRGALSAAFDLALDAEVARSRGRQSASTCFDLKQYYEQVEVAEVAKGCKKHGLPRLIAALTLHMYLGPRRIRVGSAISHEVYPRRSILAGCTFALVLIRLIAIEPIDHLMKAVRSRLVGWDADIRLVLYVDDGIISTYGPLDAVALLHAWVTRLALDWIARVLKKEVAVHKLSCIASSALLVARLRTGLRDLGIVIATEGELLGVDFAAGGPVRRRRVQVARRRKAVARKPRLKWWRLSGGRHVANVAKGGLLPTAAYGDAVVGVTNAALRDYRRIHAASVHVQCAGSSLTAKLAVGGTAYADHDPAVIHSNPTLMPLLRKLWDQPGCRGGVVMGWRRAQDEVANTPTSEQWAKSGGPIMATLLHFNRVGIRWVAPFRIVALDHEVDLIATPPKQVLAIVAAHARRHLDAQFLGRLGKEHDWDMERVKATYRHGVDWELLRQVLRGGGDLAWRLSAEEKVGLHLLVCGGFWPEHRRWRVGIRDSAQCDACKLEEGTEVHRIHTCGAMAAELAMRRAAGTIPPLPRSVWQPELAPLFSLGLPPKLLPWEPVEVKLDEGQLEPEGLQVVYGDGSGYHQQVRELRRATWALATMEDASGKMAPQTRSTMRGGVSGWYPTVPRGELSALVAFLKHAGPNACFVTDCQGVADGVRMGVPASLKSASCINADLWRAVCFGLRDRDEPTRILKTKAHRSQAAAGRDEVDHLGHWWGNRAADEHAKQLAYGMTQAPNLEAVWAEHRAVVVAALKRAAVGVAWALGRWPALERRRDRVPSDCPEDGDQETGHVLRRRPEGAIECTLCKKYVRSDCRAAARFRRELCSGSILSRIDETHALRVSSGVTWCQRCGGFSSRWLRSLMEPCLGRPPNATRRNILKRLNAGLLPTAQAYLRDVAQDQGAPADAPDHQGLAAWSAGRRAGRGAGHAGSVAEVRLAAPPSRTYGRLPVYRPQAAAGAQEQAGVQEPRTPPRVPSPPRTAGEAQRPSCHAQCQAGGAQSAAARLRACAFRSRDDCGRCGASTTTFCRGCGARLCLACARKGLRCRSPSADPVQVAADRRSAQGGKERREAKAKEAPSTSANGAPETVPVSAVQAARDLGDAKVHDGARGDRHAASSASRGPTSRGDLLRALARTPRGGSPRRAGSGGEGGLHAAVRGVADAARDQAVRERRDDQGFHGLRGHQGHRGRGGPPATSEGATSGESASADTAYFSNRRRSEFIRSLADRPSGGPAGPATRAHSSDGGLASSHILHGRGLPAATFTIGSVQRAGSAGSPPSAPVALGSVHDDSTFNCTYHDRCRRRCPGVSAKSLPPLSPSSHGHDDGSDVAAFAAAPHRLSCTRVLAVAAACVDGEPSEAIEGGIRCPGAPPPFGA